MIATVTRNYVEALKKKRVQALSASRADNTQQIRLKCVASNHEAKAKA